MTEFARCPRSFALKRHEGAPQLPAPWAGHGSAGHHALLDVWEANGRTHTASEVQEAFVSKFREYIAEYDQREPDRSLWLRGGRKSTDRDIADREALGIEQVANYMQYVTTEGLEPWEIDGRPAVELPFKINIGEGLFGEPIIVRGFIDALYRDVNWVPLVRDLKFGKRPAWDFQLWMYGIAVREEYDIDVEYGDFFLCKENAPTNPVELLKMPDEEVLDLVIKMDAADMIGYYNPNPGEACRTCDVQRSCKFFA
ncbi:PD-(D/E)XK nuclease family protein [Actinomadura rubrisoli]|uniref:PD-(D/E)XK nuclease family protein n=1 Tax=Actinomadura rubrisoli TaxID=2530368 RepID=UPI001404941C|nr:PD-(D/E)XK nuclease family protein [Actinomadura rubrisoli]